MNYLKESLNTKAITPARFKEILEENNLSVPKLKKLIQTHESTLYRWTNGYSPVPQLFFAWLDTYCENQRLKSRS